jgi:hypothetical protein
VVNTGLPAGSTTIDRPWTSTFIFGLVPATPIDVRSQCTNGVAIVDTQMTFLNGLVGALTLGIYTPLSVSVTCASGGSAMRPGTTEVRADDGSDEAFAASMSEAVLASRLSGAPVVLVWSSTTR